MAKIKVTYNDQTFSDTDDLATYLNISPNTLLALLKRGFTVSEIVEHNKILWPMAERRRRKQQPIPVAPGNHCRSCQVAGTVYASQMAAARAYHVPIQTIYSRMKRQGMTFEAAILRGYREEHLLDPIPELHSTYKDRLKPVEQLSCKSLVDYQSMLQSAGFICKAMQTENEAVQAIQTQFEIWDGNLVDIWFLYLRERELLETIIPSLCTKWPSLDIGQLNSQTSSVRFWPNESGMVSASTSERFRPTSEGGKYALRSLYQFLGACTQIKKQLED